MSAFSTRAAFIAFLFLVLPFCSYAADGLLEINQSCAVNTGCFTGDSAGFPVTITTRGSYVLTGNLEIASANQGGIELLNSAEDATIDLNGFAIVGPGSCSINSCTTVGTGSGIRIPVFSRGVTVKNGHIKGMGSWGIISAALGTRVDNVTASENAGGGISGSNGAVFTNNIALFNGSSGLSCSDHCVVKGCTARANGIEGPATSGIFASEGSTVIGNTAQDNIGDGILTSRAVTVMHNSSILNGDEGIRTAEGSTVIGNSIRDNTGTGLTLGENSGYGHNVITSNGGTVGVVSGTAFQLDTNVCGTNTTCP